MREFFALRRMWTPVLVPLVLGLSILLVIIGGVALMVVGGLDHDAAEIGVGVAVLLVGPPAARLSLEAVVLPFRINETLTELLYELREQSIFLAATAEREGRTDPRAGG